MCEANGVTGGLAKGHLRRVPGAPGRRRTLGWTLVALSLSGIDLLVVADPGLGKDVRLTQVLQNVTGPGITDIMSGTAADGDAWTLYVNGPNQNLCLSVELKGSGVSPGACTSEALPVARQRPERVYRPLSFSESRRSAFLYGRMPEGTENVSVLLSTGSVLAARETIAGPTGRFYVIGMPEGAKPIPVLGSRGDGTSASYPVEWPFDSNGGGRARGGMLVLTALATTVLCRSVLARRRSRVDQEHGPRSNPFSGPGCSRAE